MDCQLPAHSTDLTNPLGTIALVGHPNVGKSVLFQKLTGQHVTVSNYPGTTVEVARGAARAIEGAVVVDTPGIIAFPPHSEDEQVTERLLLGERQGVILQVGDAKNLRRTLLLTIQLAEMGLPMVLSLNMMDEARQRGVAIDYEHLSGCLGVKVVLTTAIRGHGIADLTTALNYAVQSGQSNFALAYPQEIEEVLEDIRPFLPEAAISKRSLALLWLSEDTVSDQWLQARLSQDGYQALSARRNRLQEIYTAPLSLVIQQVRLEYAAKLAAQVLSQAISTSSNLTDSLGRLSAHPLWGLPILAVVLMAIFWFVGIFGAGTLVGFFEEHLFGAVINPFVFKLVEGLIPFTLIRELLVGDYGLWTMGMTYALALILPIVTTFFLAFGALEDSGYLPRLAVLTNRIFQSLGLNGKAVLPMVLGLGCVTMATLTTRVLESKRERVLATLLLALAVPCSAQLGVVMGMLAGVSFGAVMIWSGGVLLVLLAIGWLAARLMPGNRTPLMVELPPLRLPVLSNVFIKTLARLEWYIKEVVPLFLIGAVLMFSLDQSGILDWVVKVSEPLVTGWLGLPAEASGAFLMGFLRRDFGATGLFVMQSQGALSPMQVVVAMVTITLFIPCIAAVMMMAKERGWKTAIALVVMIMPLAFIIGGLLKHILLAAGWE